MSSHRSNTLNNNAKRVCGAVLCSSQAYKPHTSYQLPLFEVEFCSLKKLLKVRSLPPNRPLPTRADSVLQRAVWHSCRLEASGQDPPPCFVNGAMNELIVYVTVKNHTNMLAMISDLSYTSMLEYEQNPCEYSVVQWLQASIPFVKQNFMGRHQWVFRWPVPVTLRGHLQS